MPIRAACIVVATTALFLSCAARGDVVAIVNDIRATGCERGMPVGVPVERDSALDAAARLVARGAELANALEDAAYRASRSNLINIGGAADDAAIREVLADGFCADVGNPTYTAAGTYERGKEFWLVLAAPSAAVTPGTARTVEERVLELVNRARTEGHRCSRRSFAA